MSTAPTGVAALPGIAAAAEAGAAEAAAAGPAAAAVAAATVAVAGVAAAVAAGAAAAAAAAGVEAAAHERSAGVTVAAIAVARGAITEVITTPPPKPLAIRPEARSQLRNMQHNMQPLRVQWRRPDRNHGTRKFGVQHPQTWYLCSSGGPSPCSGGQQPCPHHP